MPRWATTRRPIHAASTSGPTASTTPATSRPGTVGRSGSGNGPPEVPARMNVSSTWTPAAPTAMRTWLGSGLRVGDLVEHEVLGRSELVEADGAHGGVSRSLASAEDATISSSLEVKARTEKRQAQMPRHGRVRAPPPHRRGGRAVGPGRVGRSASTSRRTSSARSAPTAASAGSGATSCADWRSSRPPNGSVSASTTSARPSPCSRPTPVRRPPSGPRCRRAGSPCSTSASGCSSACATTSTGCIGCGCLSMASCRLRNPYDRAHELGRGPRYLFGDSPGT